MAKYVKDILELAKSWIGRKESDGTHKMIIDIYNSHKPLARGYKVKYTDSWCATFISALAIKLGYTDIIPTECGCQQMIDLFKKLGCWIENENRVPNIGDIIFYDWQDNGKGDNKGWSDHVGIVESVSNGKITIIEGNFSNSVKRRMIDVNGKYIRGYGVPKYDPETTHQAATTPSSKFNPKVKEWQEAAIADGFTFPKYGADGEWGAECEAVAKIAVVKERKSNKNWVWKYPNLTRFAQKELGFTGDDIDGKCGNNTGDRIEDYQAKHGLKEDRCCGLNTWKEMLGV